jgi:hypothetical protein
MVGFMAETGPMLLTEDNTFIDNPYAWNKVCERSVSFASDYTFGSFLTA